MLIQSVGALHTILNRNDFTYNYNIATESKTPQITKLLFTPNFDIVLHFAV